MLPIGTLMREHRVIERMVKILEQEIVWSRGNSAIGLSLIDAANDSFRVYADKTHHCKEEDILFRELTKKKLSTPHRMIMEELISGHIHARQVVGRLAKRKSAYSRNDTGAADEILKIPGRVNND